jgi:hypothetical protein
MSSLPEEVAVKPTTTQRKKKTGEPKKAPKTKKAQKLGGIIKVEGPVVVTFN